MKMTLEKADERERNLPAFLEKTYAMIEKSPKDIAGWSLAGDTFIVKNPIYFAEKVIPEYFKHRNFSSFVRQLNFYGFRKLKLDSTTPAAQKNWWEFKHEKFIRGGKDMMKDIRRKTNSDACAVDRADIESLKIEVANLRDQLSMLTTSMQNVMIMVSNCLDQYRNSNIHKNTADLFKNNGDIPYKSTMDIYKNCSHVYRNNDIEEPSQVKRRKTSMDDKTSCNDKTILGLGKQIDMQHSILGNQETHFLTQQQHPQQQPSSSLHPQQQHPQQQHPQQQEKSHNEDSVVVTDQSLCDDDMSPFSLSPLDKPIDFIGDDDINNFLESIDFMDSEGRMQEKLSTMNTMEPTSEEMQDTTTTIQKNRLQDSARQNENEKEIVCENSAAAAHSDPTQEMRGLFDRIPHQLREKLVEKLVASMIESLKEKSPRSTEEIVACFQENLERHCRVANGQMESIPLSPRQLKAWKKTLRNLPKLIRTILAQCNSTEKGDCVVQKPMALVEKLIPKIQEALFWKKS